MILVDAWNTIRMSHANRNDWPYSITFCRLVSELWLNLRDHASSSLGHPFICFFKDGLTGAGKVVFTITITEVFQVVDDSDGFPPCISVCEGRVSFHFRCLIFIDCVILGLCQSPISFSTMFSVSREGEEGGEEEGGERRRWGAECVFVLGDQVCSLNMFLHELYHGYRVLLPPTTAKQLALLSRRALYLWAVVFIYFSLC